MLLCNVVARLVNCVKILQGEAVVSHLGWARGFPRKRLVFSIFANIYFLPSQEQSVQIGLLTVCENLATCGRTQFTPLLCLVLLKLNNKIVKEGKLTFDVGEHHAKLGLFKDFESSPSTFSCCRCEVVDSDEPVSILEITQNDPSFYLRVMDLMVLWWILCRLALLRKSPMLLMRVI